MNSAESWRQVVRYLTWMAFVFVRPLWRAFGLQLYSPVGEIIGAAVYVLKDLVELSYLVDFCIISVKLQEWLALQLVCTGAETIPAHCILLLVFRRYGCYILIIQRIMLFL